MAIMNKLLFASAALVAFVNAVPMLNARDMVTETTWTTVDVDITVWVDANGTPVSTETGTPYAQAVASASASTSSTAAAAPAATTTSQPAASFYQAPPTPAADSPSSPAPSQAQPTTTQAPAAAPAPESPAPQSSSVAAAAAPAAPAGGNNYGTGSGSASCEGSGNLCSGKGTYYDGGLGACGNQVNSNSDLKVALPAEYMGSGYPSPYCGRKITIINPSSGATVEATVDDKCMGCTGRAIDLTHAAWAQVAKECDGTCPLNWFLSG